VFCLLTPGCPDEDEFLTIFTGVYELIATDYAAQQRL
jgi:hypothetical protein